MKKLYQRESKRLDSEVIRLKDKIEWCISQREKMIEKREELEIMYTGDKK